MIRHAPADGARRQRFLWVAALYVVVWVATWYSASVLETISIVSLWFLPAGLRFFCLLVFGWAGVALELAVQAVFALMQIAGIAGTPITDYFSANTLWRIYNLLCSLVINAAIVLSSRQLAGRYAGLQPAGAQRLVRRRGCRGQRSVGNLWDLRHPAPRFHQAGTIQRSGALMDDRRLHRHRHADPFAAGVPVARSFVLH